VGPYKDIRVCPPVAGGGGGIQTWRVAASVSNKRLQTVDKGGSSSLGGGRCAEISHLKESTYYVMLHTVSALE
jgi:hypothetical protein